MPDIDILLTAVRNAHREHFTDTIRVLFRELGYDDFRKVALQLAEEQLERELSPVANTER